MKYVQDGGDSDVHDSKGCWSACLHCKGPVSLHTYVAGMNGRNFGGMVVVEHSAILGGGFICATPKCS